MDKNNKSMEEKTSTQFALINLQHIENYPTVVISNKKK